MNRLADAQDLVEPKKMKVVLFCGGYGMRIRGYSESIPKPMVPIGYRPIIWHVMKYYAHFGHRDFILCLGWQANIIKDYFLNYDECISNDFVLSHGGKQVELLGSDIDDWNITFVDTGHNTSIGGRLKAVEKHVGNDDTFLANYTDGLSDLHLPDLISFHEDHDALASFVSVRPSRSFHVTSCDEFGRVSALTDVRETNTWMNGGFFVLSSDVFRYMREGEELVGPTFERISDDGRLFTMKYDGYWSCMDTYKEKESMDEMVSRGNMPWMIWRDEVAQYRPHISRELSVKAK